ASSVTEDVQPAPQCSDARCYGSRAGLVKTAHRLIRPDAASQGVKLSSNSDTGSPRQVSPRTLLSQLPQAQASDEPASSYGDGSPLGLKPRRPQALAHQGADDPGPPGGFGWGGTFCRVEDWRGAGRSPFPAPASSNGANGFPVRRSPVCVASWVMRPSDWER